MEPHEQAFNEQDKLNQDLIDWIESNEEEILESYKESLNLEDVPDDFINEMHIKSLE